MNEEYQDVPQQPEQPQCPQPEQPQYQQPVQPQYQQPVYQQPQYQQPVYQQPQYQQPVYQQPQYQPAPYPYAQAPETLGYRRSIRFPAGPMILMIIAVFYSMIEFFANIEYMPDELVGMNFLSFSGCFIVFLGLIIMGKKKRNVIVFVGLIIMSIVELLIMIWYEENFYFIPDNFAVPYLVNMLCLAAMGIGYLLANVAGMIIKYVGAGLYLGYATLQFMEVVSEARDPEATIISFILFALPFSLAMIFYTPAKK